MGSGWRTSWTLVLLAFCAAPSSVWAFRSGPPPGFNGSTASGGNSCRLCHGTAGGLGSVQIIGFPTQYVPSALYNIGVRVADPDKAGAGFQISFETATGMHAGTIIRTDLTGTQHNGGWLNHTSTGVNNAVSNWFSDDSYTYQLRWQAPAVDLGPIRAWAAGNAINNNGSSTGDTIYLTNLTATFQPARGACCDESSGICDEDVLETDCAGLDDRYGGHGSTCATMTPACSTVTGGCCDGTTGECVDGVVRVDCIGDQLTFHEGLLCADLISSGECERHRGACCDGTTGTCEGDTFPEECTGDQEEWFKGAECSEILCEQHRGACCDTSPGAGGSGPEGVCSNNVLPGDCAGPQQIWAKQTDCANLDPPCLETTGVCCNTLDGTCEEDVYSGQCQGTQRSWTKGMSCTEVTCDARPGACCDQDTFGGCSETTNAQCQCPTCVWHKLQTCDQIECLHNAIPTVSQWGLIVMTLMLLIAAKVSFGRRMAIGAS